MCCVYNKAKNPSAHTDTRTSRKHKALLLVVQRPTTYKPYAMSAPPAFIYFI